MALKVKGLSIHAKQGDFSTTSFIPEAIEADFDTIKSAMEATGEMTVTGYGVVYREDAPGAIAAGTAGVTLEYKTVNLKNAAGLVVATMQGKLPDDNAKLTAMANVAKAKTIALQPIDEFSVKSGSTSF